MKRFALIVIACLLATSGLQAQDAATEEQLNRLRSEVSALQSANVELQKKLSEVLKELQQLRMQSASPKTEYAAAADVKRLADAIEEVDRKREADRKLILGELKILGEAAARAPQLNTDQPSWKEHGYDYEIRPGDTLSAIAKAYRESEKRVNVTVNDILKANPGLDANSLQVGKTIFIPDPKR